ncbi:MAG: hypothetical protein CVU90_15390 [Firmicutes bacterium HGW-Firmicutes-15]|nr:MAG: hypothetical protein CVU90_15390 [Firmicutes bacterium HGW-Firmicutes-15]
MIMSKHFRSCIILTLVFLVILPQVAAASDVEWQILWQENGILQEEVKITGGDIVPRDQDWNIRREGNQYILYREVKNWSSYQELQDRLPIKIRERNYIVFKQTEIDIIDDTGGLFVQLNSLTGFHLTMVVPGIITGNYGDRISESSSNWFFSSSAELLKETRILKFITVDGLLMGIGIFFLGLLAIVIQFIRRLKKVGRIIEEEYSLKSIKPIDAKEQDTQEKTE